MGRLDVGESATELSGIRFPRWREGWVKRVDLLQRMSSSNTPCILVAAPPGFGKTAVLTQFAHGVPRGRVAWVTVEHGDDAVDLFRKIVGSVRRILPEVGKAAWVHRHVQAADLAGHVVQQLVDTMGHEKGVTLIIDEYDRMDDEYAHASMRTLASHLPPSVQMVIGTRTVPGMGIPRLRASGRLTEIKAADLAFTEAEASSLLRRSQPRIAEQAIAEAYRRTEGWPIGVYLASREAGDHDQPRSRRREDTYASVDGFVADLVAALPADERALLRKTSVLGDLNPELCDFVAERTDSAALLWSLSNSDLMVEALSTTPESYRCHSLLREALLSDLQPQEACGLHLRAHQWFLERAEISEAIRHAIQAGEVIVAADLVCASILRYAHRPGTMRKWLRWFPEDLISGYPPLAVAAAHIYAFVGAVQRSRHFLQVAGEATFEGKPPDGSSSFASAVALCRGSYLPRGVADGLVHAEEAYRSERSGSPWRTTAAIAVGFARMASGDHDGAVAAFSEAAQVLDAVDPSSPLASAPSRGPAAYAHGQLAILAVSAGRWDDAERAVHRSLHYSDSGVNLLMPESDHAVFGVAQAAAASLALHRGNRDVARAHLETLASLLPSSFPHLELQLRVLAAETSLALGEARAASQHARAGASALDLLGDGGIYTGRLAGVFRAIEEVQSTPESPEPDREPVQLSEREREVLRLFPSNLTAREMAASLYISRNTVKTHSARILRKLGVHSRQEAVARARELRLL